MRIAINIDGQFPAGMTGVQNYVDSLLTAFTTGDTGHEIVAFAASLHHPGALRLPDGQLRWGWQKNGRARIESAGNAALLAAHPRIAANGTLVRIAHRLDATAMRALKRVTRGARVRAATRRFDVLHQPYPLPSQQWHRARHHVATIYDMTTRIFPETHDPANIAAWDGFFDLIRRRCERVLTLSEWSKRDIVAHLGIPEDRIDVTPLAPRAATRPIEDGERLRALLQTLDLGPDTPFVLCAATLERRKNLERLVEAFAHVVRQERFADHRLVLAGGNRGDHGDELRTLAQTLGIGDRLVLPGYVSDDQMNALMTGCAVFAYVSRYEGFGLPPLEAMVCGAPVVVSNASSLPEVVGDAGIQVEPDDVAGMAGALYRLLSDGTENARQRALSRARAACFTWEHTAALTLRSYEAAASA